MVDSTNVEEVESGMSELDSLHDDKETIVKAINKIENVFFI